MLKRNMDMTNVSFLLTTASDIGYIHNRKMFEDTLKSLLEQKSISLEDEKVLLDYPLPKQLDVDFRELGYLPNQINENVYKSIVNLVTENLFGISHGDITEDKIVTFTEKIMKPFQARQIPIFLGLPNLQSTLRELGFDLYDDIVDTSFESEPNHIIRMQKALDELNRLLSLDLIQYKNKNKERFEKNYNLLLELSSQGKELVEEFLLEHIFDIEKLK
jgi:predicted unusual protein kinase regulating ubiquinone biosynthesis (AarF/ABC1/UbiB family)